MTTQEEIRQIMREALERQRDQALSVMSTNDQRLVNIAPNPTLKELHDKSRAAYLKALLWPTVQAIAACVVIGAAFVLAAFASWNGHPPNALTGPVTSVSGLFALLSLAQFTYLARSR